MRAFVTERRRKVRVEHDEFRLVPEVADDNGHVLLPLEDAAALPENPRKFVQERRVVLDVAEISGVVAVSRVKVVVFSLLLCFVILLVEDVPVWGAGDYEIDRVCVERCQYRT